MTFPSYNYSAMWQNAAAQNNFNPFVYNNNMNFNSCWNNNFGFNNTGFNWNSPMVGNSVFPTQTETSESSKTEHKSGFQRTNSGETQNEDKKEEADWKLLADDYSKSLTPSESFAGAAAGGAAFGVIQNPRTIVHPINSVKGFKDTKQMFSSVTKNGSKLNTAWKANSPVMEEAYAAMQKLSSRHNSKIGLFRHSLSDARYNRLKNIMTKALETGDTGKIAEATAKLKHSYVNDGYIPKAWQKVKGLFGGTPKAATVSTRLGETEKIAAETAKILEHGKDMSFKTAFKGSGGVGGSVLMAGIEVFMAKDKIKAAFDKDSDTGWKQVKQTAVKAGGSAAGWALGQSLGTLAWATKLGASIGTCFGPIVGTAIGAVVGLAAGSIGCWAAGKLTHWMMGDDVGDKVIAENKTQTDKGKIELLQNAVLRAQNGEIKDEKTLKAVQELSTKYA